MSAAGSDGAQSKMCEHVVRLISRRAVSTIPSLRSVTYNTSTCNAKPRYRDLDHTRSYE